MQRDNEEIDSILLLDQAKGASALEDTLLPSRSIGNPTSIRSGHQKTRRLEDFGGADDPDDNDVVDGGPEGAGTQDGDGAGSTLRVGEDSNEGMTNGSDSNGEDGGSGDAGFIGGDSEGSEVAGSDGNGGNYTSNTTGGEEWTGSDSDGGEDGGEEYSGNDNDSGEDSPSSSGNEQGSAGDGSSGGSDEAGGSEQGGQGDEGDEDGDSSAGEEPEGDGSENPEDEPSDSFGGSPSGAPVSSTPMPTRRHSHSHSAESPQSSPLSYYEPSEGDSQKDKSYVDVAKEEYDSMVHDRNVAIVASVFGAIGFILLLITAQQIIENPDGCCAKICRFSITFWRVVCWPCRKVCCRGKKRRGHTVIADDGYAGYSHDLELS
jgi:hypothetical protein